MLYRFCKPTLVVFEGLDAAGKTTQAERFKGWPYVIVEHQPSGAPGIGADIYRLTENALGLNDTARQFLHLACHAQHWQDVIAPAMATKTVILDRWWWSTLAYGYFEAGVGDGDITPYEFAKMSTLPIPAELLLYGEPPFVVMFDHPWADDSHNTPALVEGYKWITDHFKGSWLVHAPVGTPDEVHQWIVEQMLERKLIEEVVDVQS